MKKVLFVTCFLIFSAPYIFAQNVLDKEKLINDFISCFTTKSTTTIEPYLGDDFTISGYPMPLSLNIFQAITQQLNDNIDSARYINTANDTITYDVYFKSKKREVSFLISSDQKLKEIIIEGVELQAKKTNELGTALSNEAPNSICIPFKLYKKLPVVTVTINGSEQNFIFDSGAPSTILNSKYYNSNSYSIVSNKISGVAGNEVQSDIQKISELNLNGLRAENVDLMCIDISHLEEKNSIPIHGLIGYSFIKDFDIVYDYTRQTITLIKKEHVSDYISQLKSNNMVEHSVEMQQRGHIPYVAAYIDSKEYLMGIDSGASSNLLNDSLLSDIKSITRTKNNVLKGGDSEGIKRRSGKVKNMVIGNIAFSKVPTIFSNIDHLNKSTNVELSGLIGYPILSKQKCMVSYHTGSLLFLK